MDRLSWKYCNNPKFSDRQVCANSEDPDQTSPEEQSDQGLYCLPFHLHLSEALVCGKSTLLAIFLAIKIFQNLMVP